MGRAKTTEKADRAMNIHFMSEEEGRALFDKNVRRELGMSTEEFLRALDAGEFANDPERIMDVLMLLPLVRS